VIHDKYNDNYWPGLRQVLQWVHRNEMYGKDPAQNSLRLLPMEHISAAVGKIILNQFRNHNSELHFAYMHNFTVQRAKLPKRLSLLSGVSLLCLCNILGGLSKTNILVND